MLFGFRGPMEPVTGEELPSRLLLAKWGRNENVKGAAVIVNETTVRHLPAVNRALGGDTIAVDSEHETVYGSDAFKASQEPCKVAAHGVPRVVAGEGLFIENIRWTHEGEASVKGGHHPDLSPAVKTNDRSEVLFRHSGALCRHGAIPNLQVFTAGLSAGELITFSAAISTQPLPILGQPLPILGHKKLTTTVQPVAAAPKSRPPCSSPSLADPRRDLGHDFGGYLRGLLILARLARACSRHEKSVQHRAIVICARSRHRPASAA